LRLPNLAAEFEAVFAGDHDVQKEERGTLALGFGEDSVTGRVEFDGKPGAFEVMAHEPGDVRIIFDNGDVRFHENIVAGVGLGALFFNNPVTKGEKP
jgi:hypothetical protein